MAFAAVTVRTEDPPEVMEVGFAVSVTDGAAVTVTVAVAVVWPPAPVAVAV